MPEITVEQLEAMRREHQEAIKQKGAELNAHAGAIQTIDLLIEALKAPAADLAKIE